LAPGPRRRYLEYVGGGSSKFYAVTLEQEPGETWRVMFNFGRIGFPRAWASRVDGAPWAKAIAAYTALIDEKLGKGYEARPWPVTLTLPDGSAAGPDEASEADGDATLFRSRHRGTLPPASGGILAGVSLPEGRLYSAESEGGPRGDLPVIWASAAAVKHVADMWSHLADAFGETGIWPVIVDATYGFDGFGDYLIDLPRGRHTEVTAILRKGWNDSVNFEEESPDEHVAPFGNQFPGLADATPGQQPASLDRHVAPLEGHLALIAVNRPADVLDAIGWMGAANYDGDPLDMSTVLRSWEARFDAYLVGLGTDTLILAVGRPARDLASASAIAAEHLAFCPDNIDQGPGSIRDYAPGLVNAPLWAFWWD
jgi:predicted DNA-binding WGR domain protein